MIAPQTWRHAMDAAIPRVRLGSGLILFAYVLTHSLNHALGLISLEALGIGQRVFLAVWRQPPVEATLLAAVLAHYLVGMLALYRRKSLRMPVAEALQLLLGLSVPPLIMLHVLGTAGAHHMFGLADRYEFVLFAVWKANPTLGALQAAALVVAWCHGCIGLNFWLKNKPWFPRLRPALFALALLIPVAALLGFVSAGRDVARAAVDPDWLQALFAEVRVPSAAEFGFILDLRVRLTLGYMALTGGVLLARLVRWAVLYDRTLAVVYPNGRRVAVQPGTSLLEASRIGGIPHASVCGGRGRCSTCRVHVIAGAAHLSPRTPIEAKVLNHIGAPPTVRLACQARPQRLVKIHPLLPPGISAQRALADSSAAPGKEREVAVLFADLRGFTRMSEQRLPYDIVFLLNQYFRAMGESIHEAGGHLDKFIGDGVMALFGLDGRTEQAGMRALAAARRMAERLEALNEEYSSDLKTPLKIGFGIHFGPAIVGELGYATALTLTAIGDTVNTASRLESATKDERCQVLISEAAATNAMLPREIGRRCQVALRGREEVLTAYAVADARALPMPEL
jgi:adenylate cyclase